MIAAEAGEDAEGKPARERGQVKDSA